MIEVLLDVGENSVLHAALLQKKCDTNFDTLLSMDEAEIDNLEYNDPHDGQTYEVSSDEKTCLKELKAFHLNTLAIKNAEPDWLEVTDEEFGNFLIYGGYYVGMSLTPSPESPEKSTEIKQMTTEDTTTKQKTADIHKPSTTIPSRPAKRNPNVYPILEDENNGNYWIKRFRAIAASQGLSNILEPAYKPQEAQAITQFDEEQDFLFDVLCTTVTFPRGKAIVRKYERGRDAQGALESIVNYFITLEKELLRDITTTKLIEPSCDRTTHRTPFSVGRIGPQIQQECLGPP